MYRIKERRNGMTNFAIIGLVIASSVIGSIIGVSLFAVIYELSGALSNNIKKK
jgi:hypothetical protein